jgi:hypothetical protein
VPYRTQIIVTIHNFITRNISNNSDSIVIISIIIINDVTCRLGSPLDMHNLCARMHTVGVCRVWLLNRSSVMISAGLLRRTRLFGHVTSEGVIDRSPQKHRDHKRISITTFAALQCGSRPTLCTSMLLKGTTRPAFGIRICTMLLLLLLPTLLLVLLLLSTLSLLTFGWRCERSSAKTAEWATAYHGSCGRRSLPVCRMMTTMTACGCVLLLQTAAKAAAVGKSSPS